MGRKRIERWKTPPGWMAKDGCTILDCGRPGIARGMCWNHYQRARRGEPVFVFVGGRGRYAQAIRFGPAKPKAATLRNAVLSWSALSNWTPEPTTGCHLWLGTMGASGYGRLGRWRDPWGGYAHRAALFFSGVQIRPGNDLHVRHACNNPACVNLAHLRYGTAAENVADRTRRYESGEIRRPRGWGRPRKLTPSLVAYIREAHAAGATKAELARDLSLHWNTIAVAVLHHQQPPQRAA